jgi:hypothetical protein
VAVLDTTAKPRSSGENVGDVLTDDDEAGTALAAGLGHLEQNLAPSPSRMSHPRLVDHDQAPARRAGHRVGVARPVALTRLGLSTSRQMVSKASRMPTVRSRRAGGAATGSAARLHTHA